jgi:hypothetical protein
MMKAIPVHDKIVKASPLRILLVAENWGKQYIRLQIKNRKISNIAAKAYEQQEVSGVSQDRLEWMLEKDSLWKK